MYKQLTYFSCSYTNDCRFLVLAQNYERRWTVQLRTSVQESVRDSGLEAMVLCAEVEHWGKRVSYRNGLNVSFCMT